MGDSNSQKPSFNIKSYCLRMALSQFLSNWDETRQDEVIDAMYSDDEELIEELKITVWDPISDHPLKNVAGFIMDAEHTLEFQLAHVINSVTDPMTEFTDNVRKLVVSIERNYPDDIAKQSAIVKAMLPAEDDDHRVPGIAP